MRVVEDTQTQKEERIEQEDRAWSDLGPKDIDIVVGWAKDFTINDFRNRVLKDLLVRVKPATHSHVHNWGESEQLDCGIRYVGVIGWRLFAPVSNCKSICHVQDCNTNQRYWEKNG